jgi:hypothetical protein
MENFRKRMTKIVIELLNVEQLGAQGADSLPPFLHV